MLTKFKISLRNIIKNRRRSLITILAIALGFAAINLFQGYVHSTYRRLVKASIQGEGLGHMTIFKAGFLTKGKLHPEKYMFSRQEIDRIFELTAKHPHVKLVTPRLDISGIISNGKNSTIFIAQGLVPADDLIIKGDILKLSPIVGEYLSDDVPSGVTIASDLAQILDLKKGDTAVILSNTPEGMANALDITVRGIFNTGRSATNDKFLQLTYQHAQDLYDFHGADRLVVLLDDEKITDAVLAEFRGLFQNENFHVDIKPWYELSQFYQQVKGMFDMIFAFVFSIVLVIVIMSVLNTMSMSVMERTREIGTLRSLGFKQHNVMALFAVEGSLLGLLGSLTGIIFFTMVYFSIKSANITYIPPSASIPVPLEIDVIISAFTNNTFFMLVLSICASFFPARKAARISIIDALGHV